MKINVSMFVSSIIMIVATFFSNTYGKNPSLEQSPGHIRIASCQFPVSSDIISNYRFIEAQIIETKLKKADVIHFSEYTIYQPINKLNILKAKA